MQVLAPTRYPGTPGYPGTRGTRVPGYVWTCKAFSELFQGRPERDSEGTSIRLGNVLFQVPGPGLESVIREEFLPVRGFSAHWQARVLPAGQQRQFDSMHRGIPGATGTTRTSSSSSSSTSTPAWWIDSH
eukprot:2871538-Rhodomonas_salina.2